MSVRKSLGIVAATRGIVFVLSLTTVVVVSRLLTPAEIGIFSVSVAAIGLAHVFRDFGVAQYLIQVREVTRQTRRAAFTVTLGFSWSIAVLLFLGRHAAAHFYQNEAVSNVLALLALNFLILPFGAPLRTLLQREMQFTKLAVVNLSNHVVQSGTTIAAAWAGASYMSMAWGSIAGNLANVVVLIAISPTRALDWPTRHDLREVLQFGSRSSVASLATEAGTAAPDLILGRTLGFADVAYFSRAKGLISMALEQLMYVVRSVYTPAFAKGFRDGRNPAELYSQTVAVLLGVTLPIIALLGVLAPQLIEFMFGDQWGRSAPLASMLCVYSLLTAPFTLAPASLVATGHVGAMMRCRLIVESSRILLLLVSTWHSLEVVVALLGITYGLEAATYMQALRRSIELRASEFWRTIRASYVLIPFALIGPVVLILAVHRSGGWPTFGLLALSGILAFVGWIVGLRVLHHPLHRELVAAASAIAERLGLRIS